MSGKKRSVWTIMGLVALGCSLLVMFSAVGAEDEATFTYTGAKKCKMCHSSAKSGESYKIWLEQGHAKAFATLQTEESNKIATDMGIKVPAAEAPECLRCHVVAHDATAEMRGKLTMEEGVSCEACHGAGSGYIKKSVMNQLFADEIEPASVGLTVIDEATCTGCHNEESPTFKEFDYKTAVAKIAHPVPPAVTE